MTKMGVAVRRADPNHHSTASSRPSHAPRKLDLHQIDGRHHGRRVRLPQPLGDEQVGRARRELRQPVPEHRRRARVRMKNASFRIEVRRLSRLRL
jgi:hypothetical protein